MKDTMTPGLDKGLLGFPKIDAHAHIYLEKGKLKEAEFKEFLDDIISLGITRVCVSKPSSGIGPQTEKPEVISAANDIVMKTVERYKGKVFGYAFIHCGYYEWAIKEMERCLASEGMIGIKLYHQYYYDDPTVISVVQAASEKNVLVLLHQGKAMDKHTRETQPLLSNGYHIAKLTEEVPKAKLICGHIGGGGDWEWTVKAIKDNSSVYVDTSGSVVDAGMVEFAARELGVKRLLFATDMSVEEGVGKILGARLSNDEKKHIFSINFQRIFEEVKR